MLPYLREHFGNPSSAHVYGARARAGVEHPATAQRCEVGTRLWGFSQIGRGSGGWRGDTLRPGMNALQTPSARLPQTQHPPYWRRIH